MVNQQLINYVRRQLSEKVAKDTIRTNLMSQGWSEQDIAEGFKAIEESQKIPTGMWSKRIPRINKVFMIISLVLVFGLDLLILISSPSLAPFWYMMLGVLAVFAVFFYLENFVFQKKFSNTKSSLDGWILTIIVIRNIVFLLNFVPFIQLLGVLLLANFFYLFPGLLISGTDGLISLGNSITEFGSFGLIIPILFVLYVILIIKRYFTTKES